MDAGSQRDVTLRLRLLGPLQARVGDREIELVAPMHRGLLAVLAANANAIVSTEQLIDELWGPAPPDGARATLQSYVSVLRRRLRAAGRNDVIVTRPPGYLLRASPDEIDTARFSAHISAARQAMAADPAADVSDQLAAALALVDDHVLEDLDHLDSVRVLLTGIDEQRRWAVEQLVESDLANDRASDAVPRLRALLETNPFEERMWGLLMRALYRSGRTAEALRAGQELRARLVEDLGIEPSAEIRAIERDILQGDLDNQPPPRRLAPRGRRMAPPPHASTALIARIDELDALETAIGTHRLVTISGPGGCGKTRLAAELAHRVAGSFDRIGWVELNALEASADIADTVADALGLAQHAAEGLIEALTEQLRDGETLLVLDNCEHVVDSAAPLAAELIGRCAGLTLLTTSRERLLVPGELEVPLAPLDSARPLELARSTFEKPSDAAAMFLERAAIDEPTRAQLGVVEAISAQLDGIPLAIELAAPLVSSMTLDEIADGLLDRFRLLDQAQRTARPQHRTLRAVVEWSHDLLAEDERAAFAALSVFRGPFSADAASPVLDAMGVQARPVLSGLVRKSVVMADTSAATTQYRVLETLRTFAAEQLANDRAAEEAVRRAFVHHWAREAVRWSRFQETAAVSAWLSELGSNVANLRAAVALARSLDVDATLRFFDAFKWYFNYLGQLAENRAWLEHLLGTAELTLEQRAVATLSLACVANFSGDYGATAEPAEEALAVARQLGDERHLNNALIMRGTTATFEGDAARAAQCFTESAALSDALGDAGGIAAAMVFWGIAYRRQEQFAEARRCFDRAFDVFSRLADERGMALVIGNLGRMAHQEGDLERARELTRQGLRMAAESLDPMVTAQSALFCGCVALDLGDRGRAVEDFETALANSLILSNRTLSSAAIEWMVLAGGGKPHDVAVIDAFTRLRRNAPGTASPRPEWEACVAVASQELAAGDHRRLTAQGEAMTLDEAVAYARIASGV